MDENTTIRELLVTVRNDFDPDAFGRLLEAHRDWLRLLARLEIDARIQAKLDASDVVQQAFLFAHRDRGTFRGSEPREFAAWLRAILVHCLSNEIRRFARVEARNIDREVSLDAHVARSLEQSSATLAQLLTANDTSPSQRAVRAEEGVELARCLARLPEDSLEVLILRSLEGLPYEDVARRMKRSAPAVRMLWLRALERLKREVDKGERSHAD